MKAAAKLSRITGREGSQSAARGALSNPLAWLALGVGLVLTAAYAMFTTRATTAAAQQEFERSARRVANHMEQSFLTPLSALHAVHALRLAAPDMDREGFSRFARPLLARHPSLAALEWLEFVPKQQRLAFERRLSALNGRASVISEPDARGQMQPAPERPSYAVLVRMEPEVPHLIGLDIGFESERARTLERAIAQGTITVSTKLRLVEDPPEVFSVAVYDPIFDNDVVPSQVTERPARVIGCAIALYRIAPLVRAALAKTDLSGADVALIDDDPSLKRAERMLFVTRGGAARPPADHLKYEQRISFADRHWTLLLSREPPPLGAPWLLPAVYGTLASALFAGLVMAWTRALRWQRKYDSLKALGQYTLLREIGSGGMGKVYEAQHVLLRRPAAIKVIAAETASDEELQRFDREAQATSELTHPNTIVIFDYGRTSRGDFFYAMEYVPGINFDELIRQQGPQPAARVRHLLLQVCGALAEAHERGFVHRDIKPANLMLTTRGGIYDFVKVLDFGLVKVTRTSDAALSRAGVVVGTPRYMAPECFVGSEAIGPQSDVYAVGCVAYFLLCGRDVFSNQDNAALALAHLTLAPPSLRNANGEPVPAALERIVMRCLAKGVDERFASMRQLMAALERAELPAWSQSEAASYWEKLQRSA